MPEAALDKCLRPAVWFENNC